MKNKTLDVNQDLHLLQFATKTDDTCETAAI